jgi:hypothetical protein
VLRKLELQPQREHHLPLQGSTQKGCVDDCPAILAIDTTLRIVEVDLIEDVKDVSTKL